MTHNAESEARLVPRRPVTIERMAAILKAVRDDYIGRTQLIAEDAIELSNSVWNRVCQVCEDYDHLASLPGDDVVKQTEVSKPVQICVCGKVLETPLEYAVHCNEAPDHFTQSEQTTDQGDNGFAGHTPGPWTVVTATDEHDEPIEHRIHYSGSDGGWLATVHIGACADAAEIAECEATARLIAAAPMLAKRDAAHTARIAKLKVERDRLREALEHKGKAQIWRDGFNAALETVRSFRTSAPPPSWDHARDTFADILERAAASQTEHANALNTGGGE